MSMAKEAAAGGDANVKQTTRGFEHIERVPGETAPLAVGGSVRVHGLVKATQYNECRGLIVRGWDPA